MASGRLLFEWHSVGNVALQRELRPPRGAATRSTTSTSTRSRSAPDGDLLLSARNTCALYELDRTTGALNWRLGGRRSDFRLGEGVRFCRQHDARWTGDGEISLFDNRIAGPSQRGQSRAVRLAVDERRKRVSAAARLQAPAELGAPNKGGARMQENGNLLVAWGAVPVITEFTRRGRHRVRRPPSRARNDGSYRALRADWTGRPRDAARRSRRSGAAAASPCGRAGTGRPRSPAGRCSAATPGRARAGRRLPPRRLRDGAVGGGRAAVRGGARAERRRHGARQLARDPARLAFAAVWLQREITLRPRPRGFHLVTDEVESALPELRELRSASRTCSSSTRRRR